MSTLFIINKLFILFLDIEIIHILTIMKNKRFPHSLFLLPCLFILSSCNIQIGSCNNDRQREVNTIYALDLEDGTLRNVYENSIFMLNYTFRNFRFVGISPENDYFYYQFEYLRSSHRVNIVNTLTGEVRGTSIDQRMAKPAISPDGLTIAYTDADGFLSISDLEGTNPQRLSGWDRFSGMSNPVWTNDSQQILFRALGAPNDNGIFRFSFTDSSYTKLAPGTSDFDLSKNEELLVYQTTEGIMIKNLLTSEVQPLNGKGVLPLFANNDSMVITENWNQVFVNLPSISSIPIFDKSGARNYSPIQNLIVSNNGDRVFFADAGEIRYYSFEDGLVKTLADESMFIPEDAADWLTVRIYLHRMLLSPDDRILYFMVSQQLNFESGC